MLRFFETIKYENGSFFLLDLHSERMNSTRFEVFGLKKAIQLEHVLKKAPKEKGLYKCRIIYSEEVEEIKFYPYQISTHRNVSLVEAEDFQYSYKAFNRSFFEKAITKAGTDDILLLKNGKITDSSYANILLNDGTSWITPETFLLNGVKRKFLLKNDLIKTRAVSLNELGDYKKIAFINAMRDFEKIYNFEIQGNLLLLKSNN